MIEFHAEKELAEIQKNVDALRFLQEEVGRYGRLSILVAQIERLKASLTDGEKHCKMVFEDTTKACQAFYARWEALQQKQVDWCLILKNMNLMGV